MEMFPLVLQNRTCLYICWVFSSKDECSNSSEEGSVTCLKYHVLKLQMVL